jgi:MFS family permease
VDAPRTTSGVVLESNARSNRAVLPTLVASVLVFAVTQGMAIPAVVHIARDFGSGAVPATWVLSGNLATTAVCLPLLGRLGDLFGRRRGLVVTLAVLTAGGVVAALAQGLPWLVAGRVVQGVGGGVFSLCYGLAREALPPEARARAVGVLATSAGVGGAAGVPLGGVVLDVSSWRWIFVLNAVAGGLALLSVLSFVPGTRRYAAGRVDMVGAVTIAVGVTLPLIVISRMQETGWSDPRSLVLLAVSMVVLAAVVPIEGRVASPLIDTVSLRRPAVVLTNAATVLVGGGNFAVMVIVPQIAQAHGMGVGLNATDAGLLILPGSLAMLVIGALAGRIVGRVGSRYMLIAGIAVAAAGFVALAVWHGNAFQLVSGVLVIFTGIGAALAAFANLIVDAVAMEQTGEATGVNGLCRIAGAAFGAQVAAAIVAAASPGSNEVTSSGAVAVFTTFAIVMLIALGLALVLPKPTLVPLTLGER